MFITSDRLAGRYFQVFATLLTFAEKKIIIVDPTSYPMLNILSDSSPPPNCGLN